MSDFDPEGRRLPIKLDSTSNGEFVPIPLDATLMRARALASERASAFSRRLGLGRRDFLTSACGAASTLLAFNAAHAAAGRTGGFFPPSPKRPWSLSSPRPSSARRNGSSTSRAIS